MLFERRHDLGGEAVEVADRLSERQPDDLVHEDLAGDIARAWTSARVGEHSAGMSRRS